MRGSIEERFWAKVHKGGDDECWPWLASKSNGLYGKFFVALAADGSRAPTGAHVVSWELAHGDVPHGMYVCHKCDNPGCVNPHHLFLGTPVDNVRDMILKGRTIFKLNEDKVRSIRQIRSETGMGPTAIARLFGVTPETIRKVLHRKQWTHIDIDRLSCCNGDGI